MRTISAVRIVAAAALVAAALAPAAHAGDWPAVPPQDQLAQQRSALLAAAEQGIVDARARWWDASAGWYTDFLYLPDGSGGNLARLWSVYPLLEALSAIEVADPTADHLAALRAFADKAAALYWNPGLKPIGGYSWYPGLTSGISGAFFDDSGWLGLAYVDAYEATHDPAYLVPAHKAFVFIVGAGWDAQGGGGTWWETAHSYKTIEPLAAAVLIGTELYKVRHKHWYLQWVDKLRAWADAHSFNAARGLYQRSPTDDTVMDYVQGLMIVADQELCTATRRPQLCAKAKQLADASAAAFPPGWWWAPQYDVVYLRWMLEYYRLTGDARWYSLALMDAQLALANGRDPGNGLFTHGWDGRWIADGLEEHAGNVALLAWAAAVQPPAG
jgi:Glycosyl hydrolase family 76